jgi:DNA-binding NarL/FixJ family response regulator
LGYLVPEDRAVFESRAEDKMGSEPHPPKPQLLLVDDEALVARAIGRQLREFELIHVSTLAESMSFLADHGHFAGAIVDIALPDGSGLDFLKKMRASGFACPVLVLTGLFEKKLAASVQLLGAEYLPKPHHPKHLQAFARRIIAFVRSDEQRSQRFIETFAQKHRLTVRQTEIVALAMAGLPRPAIAERLGVTQDTLKTHVRSVLHKCRQRSLAELATRLRLEMLSESRE